jgi:hypothetical protein
MAAASAVGVNGSMRDQKNMPVVRPLVPMIHLPALKPLMRRCGEGGGQMMRKRAIRTTINSKYAQSSCIFIE